MIFKTSLFLTIHFPAHCHLMSLTPLQTSNEISATINPTFSEQFLVFIFLCYPEAPVSTVHYPYPRVLPSFGIQQNYCLLVLTLKQPVSISRFISSSQLGILASVFSFLQMVPIPSSENSQLCLPFLFYAEEFSQKSSS